MPGTLRSLNCGRLLHPLWPALQQHRSTVAPAGDLQSLCSNQYASLRTILSHPIPTLQPIRLGATQTCKQPGEQKMQQWRDPCLTGAKMVIKGTEVGSKGVFLGLLTSTVSSGGMGSNYPIFRCIFPTIYACFYTTFCSFLGKMISPNLSTGPVITSCNPNVLLFAK